MSEEKDTAVEKAEKSVAECGFKAGDRVARMGSVSGPFGTVQGIRQETVRTSIKKDGNEAPSVTVTVLWDNGTLSHFVPDGLETVAA